MKLTIILKYVREILYMWLKVVMGIWVKFALYLATIQSSLIDFISSKRATVNAQHSKVYTKKVHSKFVPIFSPISPLYQNIYL